MPGKDNYSILKLDYNEAANLINTKIITKTHKLLDTSKVKLEDSALICKFPEIELMQMHSELFYIPPEFLVNPQNPDLIELNKNIEIYKNGYERLCKIINDTVTSQSESIKKLKDPSINLINEIVKITKQFEETVKNLCIPLISKNEGLDIDLNKLTEIEKEEFFEDKQKIGAEINKFINDSYHLYEKYNELFKKIYKRIHEICNSINEIPSTITYLQELVEEGKSNYEIVLEELTDEENYQNILKKKPFIKIKESYDIINNEVKKILNKVEERQKKINENYNTNKSSFDSLKEERKKIIDDLALKSNSIINKIKEIREKYKQKEMVFPEIKISNLIVDQLSQSMDDSLELIIEENFSIKNGFKKIECEVEKVRSKLSLDLLIVMDTTGSMEQYVEVTKKKLLLIIDKIKEKNNNVTINLGFIEYKDVIEIYENKCLDIDFTEEYSLVKEQINMIKVGGGDDTAEDVAWAFEKVNKKNWKSNCKVVILVTDAPCHGIKYHEKNLMDNYPNGVLCSINIEESVDQMAKNQICLICIKLKEDTNIMYKIFKDIYKKNNCLFDIVPINSSDKLIDQISKKTSEIYKAT